MTIATDTDIDIDFADRMHALDTLAHVPAWNETKRGIRQRHPSGVYFQNVPVDPVTGLSAFDYERAADHGYFKIDFLNNSIYEHVRDEAHLIELLNREPDWSMLAHIHSHFGVVQSIRPKSIEDLALVLALMRPGKRHLVGRPRDEIEAEIWKIEEGGYTFKKSHSVSYAASIIVQLNLICERAGEELDAAGNG